MQIITGYPTDLTVTEPSALVTVNGAAVDVASVTVTRELSSSLPAQVTAASGITAATGSVEWAVGEDVQTLVAHPWDGSAFPPKPADAVVVSMGYGAALARQLTGVVDSSAGSAAEGSVSSDLVDPIDRLNRLVTFPAMMAIMPPSAEGASMIHAGNEPTFTTDRILRACGFNATPPVTAGCVLSVPLMGSAWPEVGTAKTISQNGSPTFTPGMRNTHWGIGANSIDAYYTPDLSGVASGRLDQTLQLTFKVDQYSASGTAGSSLVRASWGADYIQLHVTPTRTIQAAAFKAGVYTTVMTMSTATAANSDTFTLRVTPTGAFTIYANGGVNQTGGSWAIPATMTGANMTEARIFTPHLAAYSIGGLQVNFGETAVYESPTTADLTPSTYGWSLPAFPRIDNRNALDVLKEQAEAECAAMWIDEYGVFTWVNREVLTGATPAATLTALDDVLDIGWESDASGVRSGVGIKSRQAKITRFPTSSVTLYTGSGESLQSGEVAVDIAEPSADESWFSLDLVGGSFTQYNKGQRTMWGGIVAKDATADVWATDVGKLGVTLDLIAPDKMVITHTAGTLAAGETVVLKTSEGDPNLRAFRRDKNLPIIRGKARVRWTDIVTKSAIAGPADAAWLEHDVGPWLQEPAEIQELADWIAGQVSGPKPVLRDLNVIPDFRRQLGDVVWVEDPENMRIKLKLLITRISTTVSAGSADQTVGGRILEALTYGATNNQLDQKHVARTNASFDTLWVDATNAALDTAPLGRG